MRRKAPLRITHEQLVARHPDVEEGFAPTHDVRVVAWSDRKVELRADYVRLVVADDHPSMGYVPGETEPVYYVLSNGLWKAFQIHGRVVATAAVYSPGYVPPRDREGVVYFLQADRGGPIKIGWTQNVGRRLGQLQTGSAERLRLLGTIPGTRATEQALHLRFAHLRLGGEWFRDSAELAQFVNGQQPCPPATYAPASAVASKG